MAKSNKNLNKHNQIYLYLFSNHLKMTEYVVNMIRIMIDMIKNRRRNISSALFGHLNLAFGKNFSHKVSIKSVDVSLIDVASIKSFFSV